MKILHLLSDWKWTGPAEPVLNLCKELERRGHEVTLAYQKPPPGVEESLAQKILREGVIATDQFHLNHRLKRAPLSFVRDNARDLSRLTVYLREEKIDILNVHQSHDHLLGGLAARRSGTPVILIRTDHKRNSIEPGLGNRLLVSRLTDGIMTFSEKAKRMDSVNFGFPSERVRKIAPALNLERFNPQRDFKDMRAAFGLAPTDVVVGMIARFQKYRRTEVMLKAVKTIVREFPKIKLLLVGRSSQMERSVIQPIKRLGIEPWVVVAGYRTDDYIDTLACMDIFVFLMAGSDGTARALREAMAMGKAVVVADRGILPELVENKVTGCVVRDTPEGLAQAVLKMVQQPSLREAMGKGAYDKAQRDFRLDCQAEAVEAFYEEMRSLGPLRRFPPPPRSSP